MCIGLSHRKDAAPRATARGGIQAADVNVHTCFRPVSPDESANEQTKAMGPEFSLKEKLVGSIFQNPRFGGKSSS